MEEEKKSKRPRIGAPGLGAASSENGGNDARYEKVNYPLENRGQGDENSSVHISPAIIMAMGSPASRVTTVRAAINSVRVAITDRAAISSVRATVRGAISSVRAVTSLARTRVKATSPVRTRAKAAISRVSIRTAISPANIRTVISRTVRAAISSVRAVISRIVREATSSVRAVISSVPRREDTIASRTVRAAISRTVRGATVSRTTATIRVCASCRVPNR